MKVEEIINENYFINDMKKSACLADVCVNVEGKP